MLRVRSRAAFVSFLLATSFVIPACGFGGGGGGGSAGAGAGPTSLAPKSTYSDDEIRHYLMRTHFGIKKSEFDAAKAQGLAAYIENDLSFAALNSTALETQAAQRLVNTNDPAGLEGMFPSQTQLARWWLHLMVANPNPVQEAIALFWHDHFAVSSAVLGADKTRYMKDLINIFRNPDRGLGNFRDLVLDVSKNGAMLVWLNGDQNNKVQPNENFARELWELFTMGVENSESDDGYTQPDIEQAAAALTGYKFQFSQQTQLSTVVFDTTKHDPNTKFIFGAQLAGQNQDDRDYDTLVDMTLQLRKDKVAHFLAKKILAWFCFEHPPAASINAYANYIKAQNFNLRPIFATLFKSQMFYSTAAQEGLIRNPVDISVGFLRTTALNPDLSVVDGNTNGFLDQMIGNFQTLGWLPTQPPTVDGFDLGQKLLGAQQMISQTNFIRYFLTYQSGAVRQPILLAMLPPGGGPGNPPSTVAVIDHLSQLFDVELNDAQTSSWVVYMNTVQDAQGNVTDQVYTPTNATAADQKQRNFMWGGLAQDPSFFVK